jgi:hypothetical protein
MENLFEQYREEILNDDLSEYNSEDLKYKIINILFNFLMDYRNTDNFVNIGFGDKSFCAGTRESEDGSKIPTLFITRPKENQPLRKIGEIFERESDKPLNINDIMVALTFHNEEVLDLLISILTDIKKDFYKD